MKQHKQLIGLALLLAGITGSAELLAHGDMQEQTHAAQTQVLKEQKDWGIAGDREQVSRSIEISMNDQMRFTPNQFEVKQGETIRFVHRNQGRMRHEFVLGTKPELDAHAALMAKFPGMQHDEPFMAHVGPGKSGEIIWTFNRAGDFDFACLMVGHYQAGMVGQVRVVTE